MAGIIEHYREFLPIAGDSKIISLDEGNTPLLEVPNISDRVNAQVFVKFEGANPTGSFKDRGMAMAITRAVSTGEKTVICASTGNTSAAAAAYAARANLRCLILIPAGKIAMGKLAQAYTYGAEVVQIDGNFDQALEIVRSVGEKFPVTIVNSINPFRIEGQKTAAFEVCDVLGDAPDALFIPVGNAGNITAYWRGFQEYNGAGKTSKLPHMFGFQAEGAAPLVKGAPVENPETIATAIRIGNPASWEGAMQATSNSEGSIRAVSDDEILGAQKLLAETEGIFCEPASAASIAGLIKFGGGGSKKIVCVLTGNGLKDPDAVLRNVAEPKVIQSSEQAVVDELHL
jgi:threonine synthase